MFPYILNGKSTRFGKIIKKLMVIGEKKKRIEKKKKRQKGPAVSWRTSRRTLPAGQGK